MTFLWSSSVVALCDSSVTLGKLRLQLNGYLDVKLQSHADTMTWLRQLDATSVISCNPSTTFICKCASRTEK